MSPVCNNGKNSSTKQNNACVVVDPMTRLSQVDEDPLKPYEEYQACYGEVDKQMQSLFNAFARSFGKTFQLPLDGNIERSREIVSKWCPHMHDAFYDTRTFTSDYILSSFFKRYISLEESKNSNNLLLKEQVSFLRANFDGFAARATFDARRLVDKDFDETIKHMKQIAHDVLGEFNLLDIYAGCKHGPNSTNSIPLENAYLHVKVGDLDGTRESLQQFWHYLQYDKQLQIELVETHDDIRAFVNALIIDPSWVGDSTEHHSVPKKFDSLRGMEPEKTIPSFFGQGWASSCTQSLMQVNIDLKSQPDCHRKLAAIGSKYPELGIATLDWTEASTRMWTFLCEEVLPEDHFNFLSNVCRCKYTTMKLKPSDTALALANITLQELKTLCSTNGNKLTVLRTKGKADVWTVKVRTNMMSTMGNAITFPLQTLLFYAFLTACTHTSAIRIAKDPYQRPPRDLPYVSSFGDDGIVPVFAMDVIKDYAPSLGWKLNEEKSFDDGAFRESCGGDYYRGNFCRPVMLQVPPIPMPNFHDKVFDMKRTKMILQAWSYVAANAALDLLVANHYDTNHIDRWLVDFHKQFAIGKVLVVPPYFPDGSGLRVDWEFDFCKEDADFIVREIDETLPLSRKDYILPWWNATTYSYVFRCLESKPADFIPDSEFAYYHDAIRRPHQTPIHNKLSFFDLTRKTAVRIGADGSLKVKECVLRSVIQSVHSWTYWSYITL